MARPREFDRVAALRTAKLIFWREGYAATTAEDLRLAMRIGRQSFYDTFGGKRPLYLEVLRQYNAAVRGPRAAGAALLKRARELPEHPHA